MNKITTEEELIQLIEGVDDKFLDFYKDYNDDEVVYAYMAENEVDFSDIHEILSVTYYTRYAYICKIYYDEYLPSTQNIPFEEFFKNYGNSNWHFVEEEIEQQYESDLCNEYEYCSCKDMTDYNNEEDSCPIIRLKRYKKLILEEQNCILYDDDYGTIIHKSDFMD